MSSAALFFVASLATAWALSLAFHPALRLSRGRRFLAGLILAPAVAAGPLLVPAHLSLGRFASAIWAGVLVMKLWDLHLGAEQGSRPSFKGMMAFMATPTALVYRRIGAEEQPGPGANLARLLKALAVVAVTGWFLASVSPGLDWTRVPFLVEHAVKATVFFACATAFFELLVAVARAVGGYSVDALDRPLTARTPARFWRRYNRCVGEFLREDVFRPAGGLRHPVRATLVAFLVSGVIHEYLFAVATGVVLGYQVLFFLLHGAAVVLTFRARPGPVVGVVGTWAFNLVSSVLFFLNLHLVRSFYSRELPAWLWGPF